MHAKIQKLNFCVLDPKRGSKRHLPRGGRGCRLFLHTPLPAYLDSSNPNSENVFEKIISVDVLHARENTNVEVMRDTFNFLKIFALLIVFIFGLFDDDTRGFFFAVFFFFLAISLKPGTNFGRFFQLPYVWNLVTRRSVESIVRFKY